MKLHLIGNAIQDYRLIKSCSSDSWRFTFRVFKVMIRFGLEYGEAKERILAFSSLKDEQKEISKQRLRDRHQFRQCAPPPGIEEIDELAEPDDEFFGTTMDSKCEIDFIPSSIISFDKRISDFYEIFVHCSRQGYCCVDFGLDQEKIYYFDGKEVRVSHYRRDPVDYGKNIEFRVRSSSPAPLLVLEKFCKAVDVPYDINFFNIFSSSVPIESFFPFDYRSYCEIFLDFLKQGWSARNVSFEGEVFYFLEGDSIFRTDPSDIKYSLLIANRQRLAKYYKAENIISEFISEFGLDLEDFNLAMSVMKGLPGGRVYFVAFFPDHFRVEFNFDFKAGTIIKMQLWDYMSEAQLGDLLPVHRRLAVEGADKLLGFSAAYMEVEKSCVEFLVESDNVIMTPSPSPYLDSYFKAVYSGPSPKEIFGITTKSFQGEIKNYDAAMMYMRVISGHIKFRIKLEFSYKWQVELDLVSDLSRKSIPEKRTPQELWGSGPNGILN